MFFCGVPPNATRGLLRAFLHRSSLRPSSFFLFRYFKDYSPICQTFRTHQGCLRAPLHRPTLPATTAGPRAMGSPFGAPQRLQRQLRKRKRRRKLQPKSGVAANAAISPQGLDAETGVNQPPSCLATVLSSRARAAAGFAARMRETGTSTLADPTGPNGRSWPGCLG